MKAVFTILLGIGNFFWSAFVTYKIYGWYAPETGLELPILTYLNIIAINFVVNVLFNSTENSLKTHFIFDDIDNEDKKGGMNFIFITAFYYAVTLGGAYLFHLILF